MQSINHIEDLVDHTHTLLHLLHLESSNVQRTDVTVVTTTTATSYYFVDSEWKCSELEYRISDIDIQYNANRISFSFWNDSDNEVKFDVVALATTTAQYSTS